MREITVLFVFQRRVKRIQEPAEKFRCIATLLHGELLVAAARYFVQKLENEMIKLTKILRRESHCT